MNRTVVAAHRLAQVPLLIRGKAVPAKKERKRRQKAARSILRARRVATVLMILAIQVVETHRAATNRVHRQVCNIRNIQSNRYGSAAIWRIFFILASRTLIYFQYCILSDRI